MVHELHKAGYQRIRISPGMSPSGMHWRCSSTFSDNVQEDGFTIREFDTANGWVAPYSSASIEPFDWTGAADWNARILARRYLEAFPVIAERGAGRDWAYAGWLTDILGLVEQGETSRYPVFYADYPLDLTDYPFLPPPPL